MPLIGGEWQARPKAHVPPAGSWLGGNSLLVEEME